MLCTPEESRMSPVNGNDARFSIPWTVAVTITYGNPTLGNFTVEGIQDEKVSALAHKVEWESNPELCAQPRNSSAIVTISCKDGNTFSGRCDDAIGCVERPMSDEDFISKFKDCCSYSRKKLSGEQVDRLLELVMNLENVEDLSEITDIIG